VEHEVHVRVSIDGGRCATTTSTLTRCTQGQPGSVRHATLLRCLNPPHSLALFTTFFVLFTLLMQCLCSHLQSLQCFIIIICLTTMCIQCLCTLCSRVALFHRRSLHAPNQLLRAELVPSAKAWHIDRIMEALDEFIFQQVLHPPPTTTARRATTFVTTHTHTRHRHRHCHRCCCYCCELKNSSF
jgi:hypothetical protein